MLELFRYYIFILAIDNINKHLNKLTDIKYIILGSFLFNLLSLIYYQVIYTSILYHAIIVMYFFNKKYQIDIRKYKCLFDYIDNSSNQFIQILSVFYRDYFNRINNIEGIKDVVTIEEYLIKLLGLLQKFIIPILSFKFYTGESLDTIYIFYWLLFLYKVTLEKRYNFVRFLHWFYFINFIIFNDTLIVYPFIASLSLVVNEFFHFGFPDKLREIFGHKPTRYCKFCKDRLTNNLLEGILLDHNLINYRTHRDCYCKYIYQSQVRYWFDNISGFFISLYIAYWSEGNAKIWLLISIILLYYNKIIKILPKILTLYSNYFIIILLLIIIGGFTESISSYIFMFLIVCKNIYTNILKI